MTAPGSRPAASGSPAPRGPASARDERAAHARPLRHAGAPFDALHARVVGPLPDLSSLSPEAVPAPLLPEVRAVWRDRARTEYRSVQVLLRFATETLAAGDPLEVHAGIVDAVTDELRHVALCAALCERLGAPALLPSPVEPIEPEAFRRAPAAERALHTAIAMLLVSETLSVGFLEDLRARCTQPAVRAVLDATLADEGEHDAFGIAYVRESLRRFPQSALRDWRHLVRLTLRPHREAAARALSDVPAMRRSLDAFPDEDRAPWGLFSPPRQALVFERTLRDVLEPRLRALGLWGE